MIHGTPIVRELVLLGGGHSHVEVLRQFGMNPIPGVKITLISKDLLTPYSGMIPGYVSGYYSSRQCHIDLVKLGAFANATIIPDTAIGINAKTRRVILQERPDIRYDVLSVNIGITPGMTVPGAAQHVTPVKPISSFIQRIDALHERVRNSNTSIAVVVVGGGAGGIELAFAIDTRLAAIRKQYPPVQATSPHQASSPHQATSPRQASQPNQASSPHQATSPRQANSPNQASSPRPQPQGEAAQPESEGSVVAPGAGVQGVKDSVVLVTRGLLGGANPGMQAMRKKALKKLLERGIVALENTSVEGVGEGELHVLERGVRQNIPYDECLWCTDAAPVPWLKETDLSTDENGFLVINENLQCAFKDGSGGGARPVVFAAGDTASSKVYPRPKAGVYAVRQGPPLAVNVRRALLNQPLKAFKPQKSNLALIGTGDDRAIGVKAGVCIEGGWLWTKKDEIDVKFMNKYSIDLPSVKDMAGEGGKRKRHGIKHMAVNWFTSAKEQEEKDTIENQSMRCGGCGGKISSNILSNVLQRLRDKDPNSVAQLHDLDDCAIVPPVPEGCVQVQTVDFMRIPDPTMDPFSFGWISAEHALSDAYAMGAQPHTALATITVPHSKPSHTTELVYHMLSGALKALTHAQCKLIGGHTAESTDLSFGLSITGYAPQHKLTHKGGVKPSQSLILTKPLGTGVALAAHMSRQCDGDVYLRVVDVMKQSNKGAGEVLREHGAEGITDVTGFGLVGHAKQMAVAGRVDISLVMSNLPVIEGVQQYIDSGIKSSLQQANCSVASAATDIELLQKYPVAADPQTSGGLLAGVDNTRVDACLTALHDAGYVHAQVIGSVAQAEDQGQGRLKLVLSDLREG